MGRWPSPSEQAWLTLAGGVVAWDMLADETLSSACHRAVKVHPRIVRGGIVALAAHLADVIPKSIDPIHWLFAILRHIRSI